MGKFKVEDFNIWLNEKYYNARFIDQDTAIEITTPDGLIKIPVLDNHVEFFRYLVDYIIKNAERSTVIRDDIMYLVYQTPNHMGKFTDEQTNSKTTSIHAFNSWNQNKLAFHATRSEQFSHVFGISVDVEKFKEIFDIIKKYCKEKEMIMDVKPSGYYDSFTYSHRVDIVFFNNDYRGQLHGSKYNI